MSWNYRICKRTIIYREEKYDEYFFVECYYDKDKKIIAISQDPQYCCGESKEGLIEDYAMKAKAFSLPVIDYETMKEIGDG